MRWLSVLLLFWSMSALADTWYIRPASDCPTNGDGTAYACAASALGVGAKNTFNGTNGFAVTFQQANVSAGDTIKLCGNFTQASANTATSNRAFFGLFVSGSSGNEITIDGDCTSEGGSSKAYLQGNYTSGSMIRTEANTYLRFSNLDIAGAKDSGMILYGTATTDVAVAKNITVESTVSVHDIHGGAGNKIGINISGTHVNIYAREIYDIGTDAIFYFSGGNSIIDGVRMWDISTDDTDGDCIQLQRNADQSFIRDVNCVNARTDSKQCVVASTLNAQTHVIDILRLDCTLADGTIQNGVYAEGQTTVRQSTFRYFGNYGLVVALNNSAKMTAIGNRFIGGASSVGAIDGHRTSAGGLVWAYHNTAVMQGGACWDFTSATAAHLVSNNSCSGAATGIIRGASGTVDSYNHYFDVATPYSSGSASSGDISGDPFLIVDSLKPSASSPLCSAGTYIPGSRDFDDLPFGYPADIGAFRCPGGDAPAPTWNFDLSRLMSGLLAGFGLLLGGLMLRRNYNVRAA